MTPMPEATSGASDRPLTEPMELDVGGQGVVLGTLENSREELHYLRIVVHGV